MGYIVARNLYMLLSGKLAEDDLVMTADSEENTAAIEAIAVQSANNRETRETPFAGEKK